MERRDTVVVVAIASVRKVLVARRRREEIREGVPTCMWSRNTALLRNFVSIPQDFRNPRELAKSWG